MISVQTLWLTLRDLTRKDNIGNYLQNDEFNRQVNLCQDIIYDYHIDKRNERVAREALVNFENDPLITKVGDSYPLPVDYRDKIEAGLVVEGEDYPIPVHFAARDELAMSLSSPVRGPSLERKVVLGRIRSTDIQIWPKVDNKLYFRYYSNPPTASRKVTVDVDEIEEVYDSGSTVDLEWPEDLLSDFVDLMLLFKGVVIRDSSLIQWVQARNVIEREIAHD